ncbi:unnamed protein product [Schistosoma curassoni]|uniref:Uncharacterized protein n=1 Tax=Schistosoma curassoni TaxID=6186 RepID=A0A183KUL2_9TREM|nr:unnamed protein product [Schistosoma curassoni]
MRKVCKANTFYFSCDCTFGYIILLISLLINHNPANDIYKNNQLK